MPDSEVLVRFKNYCQGYNPGETASFDAGFAGVLVKQGFGEYVAQAAPAPEVSLGDVLEVSGSGNGKGGNGGNSRRGR